MARATRREEALILRFCFGKAGEDLFEDAIRELSGHGAVQHETGADDKPQETGRGKGAAGLEKTRSSALTGFIACRSPSDEARQG